MHRPTFTAPTDASSFNRALRAVSLPLLTKRQYAAIVAVPRDKQSVLRALEMVTLQGHAGARKNLENAIVAAQAKCPASAAPQNGDLPPHPEAQQRRPQPTPRNSDGGQHRQGEARPAHDDAGHAPQRREEGGTVDRGHGVSPASEPSAESSSSSSRTPQALVDKKDVRVHGRNAALCAFADVTRKGLPTVMLESATCTGPKSYDWTTKIRLQCTTDEVQYVAAVLLGFIESVEFKNHGEDQTKGFLLKNQQDSMYLEMWEKGKAKKCIPIPAPKVFELAGLFQQQLCILLKCKTHTEVQATLARTLVRFHPRPAA